MSEKSITEAHYRLERISSEIVTVTPEMALRWLSCNPNNRHISEERVAKFCEKIRSGSWSATPAIEVFDTGRLWNGQHRLTAIAQVGTPVPLRVIVYRKVKKQNC